MKILYVTTISSTINAFLIPHIIMLSNKGYQVDIATNITKKIDSRLNYFNCNFFDISFQRSPLSKMNYSAYKDLKKIIYENKYDIIHTHTPIASALVRLACRNIKKNKVIYTVHGFHFHKKSGLKNWLIYYPIEKLLSLYTDLIITINKEDFGLAKEKFFANRVEYIPGVGLDFDHFQNESFNKKNKINQLNINDNNKILVSVGELNYNKNHKSIIKAIKKIKEENIIYLICGKGRLKNNLKKLIKKLNLEKKVKLLGHRNDIPEILNIADIYIHPSYREGLPLSLMEAMAFGLSIVCSNIRGNKDLVDNHKGGFLINTDDIEGYSLAIKRIINNKSLAKQMGKYNLNKIKEFDINNVLNKLEKIYESMHSNLE